MAMQRTGRDTDGVDVRTKAGPASFSFFTMRLDTFTDYFFAVLHVGILEAASQSSWRTNILRRIGIDQAY